MTPITLVLADSEPAERIELSVPLDGASRFDATRGVTGPDGWQAKRQVGDGPVLDGQLRYDEDHGWSLRFSETPGDPDAPLATLMPSEAGLELGGYVSLREPDGRVRAWQVVRLG